MSPPRYFSNNLQPISLDDKSLSDALSSLQAVITSSVQIILQYMESDHDGGPRKDSLYIGDFGLTVMFLRLATQSDAAGLGILGKNIKAQFPTILRRLLPDIKAHDISPGHLGPLTSSVGSAYIYILASLSSPKPEDNSDSTESEGGNWMAAITTLRNAVRCAVDDHTLGGDEVMFGRAGLLWVILNLNIWAQSPGLSPQKREDLTSVTDRDMVGDLIKRILEAGNTGAQLYKKEHGDNGLPLMWEWRGSNYLGAIHGIAGILTVLLQAPRELISPHLVPICSCISALCDITLKNDGHLPDSLTKKDRPYALVQICHGSPGLLLLLSVFEARFPEDWKVEWNKVREEASEKVWEEGLLSKGLGICHGLTGNGWPLLLQARTLKSAAEVDPALSRGLAFLLKATELPPLSNPLGEPSQFRTPDRPYSLFEGLSGAVCAWIDACVIINERLEHKGSSSAESSVLGLPGLGGAQVHGYF